MRSERPKPLHVICGRPMVLHVLHALEGLDVERTVVVVGTQPSASPSGCRRTAPPSSTSSFVEQRVQRGTGDAVMVGLTAFPDFDLDDTSTVLIVPGDTPLLLPETLHELVAFHEAGGHGGTILAAHMGEPTGYGRLVRDKHGLVARVVEEATPRRRSGPSRRSTPRSTASARTCSGRRCAGSHRTTRRASTT